MAHTPDQDVAPLQKISDEIAPELSPLLQFLLTHVRTFALVLGGFLLCALAYGAYVWHDGKRGEGARIELGRILASPGAADRVRELEAFAAAAPSSLRVAVNLALAQAFLETKDYAQAARAWDALAQDKKSSLHLVAMLGKAKALALQDKQDEALALLEQLKPGKDDANMLVSKAIADIAEQMGYLDKAIAASDALAANNAAFNESSYWRQKAASLRQAQAAKAAAGNS